jgi:hypothetical protein
MTAQPPLREEVSRGAGRVKTAARMLDMAEALSPRLRPGPEGDKDRQFLAEGRRFAELLLASGHNARWGHRDSILPGCGCSGRSGQHGMLN